MLETGLILTASATTQSRDLRPVAARTETRPFSAVLIGCCTARLKGLMSSSMSAQIMVMLPIAISRTGNTQRL